jgi:hypothetical protein
MADLEEIQQQQRELQEEARRLASEKDATVILAIAQRMQAQGEELLRKARSLEAAFARVRGPGQTRVELTSDQRKRVAEATGVAVDVLTLDDAQAWDPQMPGMSPAVVERLAMASVAEQKVDEAKRQQVAAIVEQLKRIPDLPAETEAAIAELEAEHGRRK